MFRFMFALEYLRNMVYTVPAILLAISAHEFAHGYVSYKLGDMTPKRDGRLTLNPFVHLDVWGTICLVLFQMGWAKPVRINAARYKNKKCGIILVSLAGPVMNYLVAFIAILVYGVLYKTVNGYNFRIWFYYLALVNVGLATFNLIPIPPLDGANVLREIFPRVGDFYARIRRYTMPILFVCLLVGILRVPLNHANTAIINGMWALVKKILNIRYIPNGPSTSL